MSPTQRGSWRSLDGRVSVAAYCGGCGGPAAGSYLRGRPRLRCRLFTNSASSTIQKDPKSSSYRTKHLCSDRFVRIAFYNCIAVKYLSQSFINSNRLTLALVLSSQWYEFKISRITMKAQSDRRGMEHRTMQENDSPGNPEGWTGKEVNRQARKR